MKKLYKGSSNQNNFFCMHVTQPIQIEKISQRTEKKLKSTSINNEANRPPVVTPEPFLVNHCMLHKKGKEFSFFAMTKSSAKTREKSLDLHDFFCAETTDNERFTFPLLEKLKMT